MQRAVAVDEVFLLLEFLTPDAVPPFVHAFIDVAGVEDSLRQGSHARMMARLGGPNEVVE